jgi:toxin-antitoxin system PIN domain toxin
LILVDANLLLYAELDFDPRHPAARGWWDAQLSGATAVCLCWPVINAFVRISTQPRAFKKPLLIAEAVERVTAWLQQPPVRLVVPTDEHWGVFAELLERGQASGNLVSDAEVAALAIEHGCELQSTDADFSRFPGLKWRNPLA